MTFRRSVVEVSAHDFQVIAVAMGVEKHVAT